MKYSDIKNAIKLVMSVGDVPIIVGESGIGKTSLVKEISKEENAKLITIDANLLKEGEIGGLPTIKDGRTVYATHNKLALADEETKKGNDVIIFIDELNRCEHAVQQELMNIILNREINGFYIDERIKVIAAVNPFSSDGYGGDGYDVVEMDLAQKDRFVWLDMEADAKEWMKWGMKDNHIDDLVIQFISAFPDYLTTKTIDGEIKPSPRSFERVSKVLRVYKENKRMYTEDVFMNIVKGNVGNEIALDFMNFIKENSKQMIEVNQIFEFDVLTSEMKEMIKKESTSRLYILIKKVLNYLEDEEVRSKKIKIVGSLLDLYPRDLRLGIMKEIKRDFKDGLYEELLDTDEFLNAFFNIYDY
ncbi:MAG: ATP-binding protein [Clostridium sp.]|uniref:ATP-binding protein n=1 Tax=Clostridium sp. TaxID=1506 RepID=UPI003EE7BA39